MRRCALFLLCASAFAGQSANGVTTISKTSTAVTGSCEIKTILNGWTLAATGNLANLGTCHTALLKWLNDTGGTETHLSVEMFASTGGGDPFNINLDDLLDKNGTPEKYAVVRIQVDAIALTARVMVWGNNSDSVPTHDVTKTFTAFGASNTSNEWYPTYGKTQFFRIDDVLSSDDDLRPTTAEAQTHCVFQLKLDSNLTDSCGGSSGSASPTPPTYTTSINQGPYAVATTTVPSGPINQTTPTFLPWISWRAGYQNGLDSRKSFSQADASNAVTPVWSQTAGASVTLDSSSSSTPLTTSTVTFGTRSYQLVVTDAAAATDTSVLQFGAVAFDNNAVVIPENANVTKIFGPMIAFGQNPWGNEDVAHLRVPAAQNTYYNQVGIGYYDAGPDWMTLATGTVDYVFGGVGPGGKSATTLVGACLANAATCAIADASKLPGLAHTPTFVNIGNSIGGQEVALVASSTATSGPAILTFGYDGRGISGNVGLTRPLLPATGWSNGDAVGEYTFVGHSTTFLTDAVRPITPAGAGCAPGPVTYSSGQVSFSASTATGTGTSWTTPNGVIAGYSLCVAATHGGGTPFTMLRQIRPVSVALPGGGVVSSTSILIDHDVPADLDPGPFNYKVTGLIYPSMEFAAADGSLQRTQTNAVECLTETKCFGTPIIDSPAYGATDQNGKHYSTFNTSNANSSNAGPNFYGSGMASRALYLRSGWDYAKTVADQIDEYWITGPQLSSGLTVTVSNLLQGGGVIGAIADLYTNPDTVLTVSDVRAFFTKGNIGALGCNSSQAGDTRDSGIAEDYSALAVLLDTEEPFFTTWKANLAANYTRDSTCKGSNNSFANSATYFSQASPDLTMSTMTPTVVTATVPGSFNSGMGNGTNTGTGHITNGSAVLTADTGTFISGGMIVATGTLGGNVYTLRTPFHLDSTSQVTLAALWPGTTATSGQISWMIATDYNWSAIGTDTDDNNLKIANYSLKYIDSSTLQINPPWQGSAGSGYHFYTSNLTGFGQQPFMLGGYKMSGLNWAAKVADSTLATEFTALKYLPPVWLHDVAYEPLVGTSYGGFSYGRIFKSCEPSLTASSLTNTQWRNEGCQTGSGAGYTQESRALNAEMTQGLVNYYAGQGYSTDARDWGDAVYGALWGYCPYTKAGYYCDENYVRDLLGTGGGGLGGYKWAGFFFGMGQAHVWPAVRISSAVPSTPTGLSASNGNALVNLTWSAATGASTYNVYRGTASGMEDPIPIVTGLTATLYQNTGLMNGTTYYYKVSAVNAIGESGLSNEANATPAVPSASNSKIGGNVSIRGNVVIR